MIGKNMLEKTPGQNLHDKIFYIVDQLNRGMDLVTKADERLQLAGMNLQAAQKAKNSTAYASASSYLKTGIGLLPDDCWENHYELTYSLYKEAMECEYLNLNFGEAQKIFDIVVKNAKSNIDKANVHSLMILLYVTQGKYEDALRVGYEGMRMVGVRLPKKVSDARLGIELLKLRFKFGRKKIEDLIDMPRMTDAESLAFLYLAIQTGTVAYYIDANIFAFIVITGVSLVIKYGNFEYSPFAYIALGAFIGSALGFYQQGYRFGLTALKLNEKIDNTKNRCRIEFLFAMTILHWSKHAKYELDYFRDAYKHGIEAGDLIFSGHSVNLIGMTRIMLGDNIDQILEEYGKYKDFQLGGKDPFVARNYLENTRMCLCLKGLTEGRGSLNGDGFDEDEQVAYFKSANNMLGTFYFSLVRLRVNYLFGEFSKCRKLVPDMQRIVRKKTALGNLHIPEFNLFHSLTLTASYPDAGFFKKILYKNCLQLNQIKMKIWAKSCPENFRHKYDLVAAEMMAIKGRYRKAHGSLSCGYRRRSGKMDTCM